MLQPLLQRNDRRARNIILSLSALVFVIVASLGRIEIRTALPFDVHIFARINAAINSVVSLVLLAGLIAVRAGRYRLHRNLMLAALLLSALFLLSYVAHHLLAGDTRHGGTGMIRYVYYVILITHILLATVILPFILFTAYRGLTAQWPEHRWLARITWPIWFYVSVSGVAVYLMISPYY